MCEICKGHPNCPVCGEEVEMIECPECDGTGVVPDDCIEDCICDNCDGTGEVEAPQYEPDPDEKHDSIY